MSERSTPVCPQVLAGERGGAPQVREAQPTGCGVGWKRRRWGEPGPDLVTGPGGAALSACQADLRHVAEEHVGGFGGWGHLPDRRAEQAGEGLARGSLLGTDPGDASSGDGFRGRYRLCDSSVRPSACTHVVR